MRCSTIIVALMSTALATARVAKRQDANVIIGSIDQWFNDITVVNNFLQGATDAQSALNAALDEPNQLMTLNGTPGLSAAGHSAAARLMANFPSIPSNLQNLIGGADDLAHVVQAITYDRCCTVLPAIQSLWIEAAATVGQTLNSANPVPLPTQCAQFTCQAFF